ncbi:MAG: response regulator [Nitrospirae bacterium]|nr:response regulator [Nitrospirota bacterium]
MKRLRVLLVEDSADQQKIFHDSVDVFNDKNTDLLIVDYKVAPSFNDAISIIDGSFDGAILDLKLNEDEDGGNKIVSQINASCIRVPVIFVTGFPDLVNEHPLIVKKRARGSETYENDIELLRDFKNTGLTHIMGGRGVIEQNLNKVFLQNLLHPQMRNAWIKYGSIDSGRTENALLRYTLNHLMQLLDTDDDRFFPEEVYLYPPLSDGIRTGSMVNKKDGSPFFVVLNPACDLVDRGNGAFKTDRILLVEVESGAAILDVALDGIKKRDKKQSCLKKVFGNNHTDYHHWIPQTSFFEGGFLNFRKLTTLSKQEFDEGFAPPKIQISPSFVKDIVARFSSYYARQGQPDIECDDIINTLIPAPDKPQ